MPISPLVLSLLGAALFFTAGVTRVRAYLNADIMFSELENGLTYRVTESKKEADVSVRLYLNRQVSFTPTDQALGHQVVVKLEKDGEQIALSRSMVSARGTDSEGAFVTLGSFRPLAAGDYTLSVSAPEEYRQKGYRIALTDKRVLELLAGIFSLAFPAIALLIQVLAKFL